jgi:hypothetical protein
MPEEDILKAFIRAYREDKNTALKILFWARDARGGAGEKRFFQVIMKSLSVSGTGCIRASCYIYTRVWLFGRISL